MKKKPQINNIVPAKGLNGKKYEKESTPRILSIVPILKIILKNVAPKFLKLGETLQSINSGAHKITDLTLDVIQTTGDKSNQSLLNNVAIISKQSLTRLKKNNAERSADLKNVESSMEYLDRLHRSLHKLRNISKTLGIVSLNIAIESSRSEKSEGIFSFFVQEINNLSNRVNIISRNIGNDSKTSQVKQQEILFHVIDRGRELQKITTTADDMIERNINKIKKLFETSREKLEESTFYSKEITRHIGEVIESIQFEDISRQQIEHIIEAIQDMEEQYNEELSLDDDHPENPEILAQIYTLITVQAAQVEQVITEIKEAYNKILNSFSEISYFIDLLVEITTVFSSKKRIQSDSGASFEDLISDFTNLDIVLDQGHSLSEKTEEAMFKSKEIAQQLSSHIEKVEEISLDLHIKAINAIIMSNQLGSEGIALSALAKNVTHISKESNDFVTVVVELINSISKSTQDLNSAPNREKNNENSTNNKNQNLLAYALDEISSTYKKFQEDSSLIYKHSTSLKENLLQAKSDISFLLEMAAQLETCLVSINQVVRSLEPHVNQSYLKEMNLNNISEKYTMKIERDIHERAFEKTSSSTSISSKQGKDMYDDLGDNVELF